MKYQNNQNNMITVRVDKELHKTGSFGSQEQGLHFRYANSEISLKFEFSLCTVIFAMIAHFLYDSEISLS